MNLDVVGMFRQDAIEAMSAADVDTVVETGRLLEVVGHFLQGQFEIRRIVL